MASPPPSSLALAEAGRQLQLTLRAALLRDVARTWTILDFQRLGATWPTWLQVMVALLSRYHAESADSGALFYRAARQAAIGDAGAAALVVLADPPAQEWIAKALGYAAPGTYARQTAAGKAPGAATRAAQALTLGTASRIMLDGGRTTIVDTSKADTEAVGFYRVTDGDPCGFCAMLAGRQIVYGDGSFTASDQSFEGPGTAKVHNDCGCSIAPAFSKDAAMPDISLQAAEIWKGIAKRTRAGEFKTAAQQRTAFAKAWRDRPTA